MDDSAVETARKWISSQLQAGVAPSELHSLIDKEVSFLFNRLSAAVREERLRADNAEVARDRFRDELDELQQKVQQIGVEVAEKVRSSGL